MKATPEDVAKWFGETLRQLCDQASMKATPEDVAKRGSRWRRQPDPCLNEGHARRRGEGQLFQRGTRQLRCLNEGHARRRGEVAFEIFAACFAFCGLNEGHARRRGEGLGDFGSFDLGKCDQLRAVLGLDRKWRLFNCQGASKTARKQDASAPWFSRAYWSARKLSVFR